MLLFGLKEQTMATRRKLDKQRRGKRPRRRTKTAAEIADEELALADELLRVSREEQADLVAGWDNFLKQLGIRCKPISPKKLREMAIREGLDPEDNQFSRGIIEMREE
jgi:hypothetical protein